MEDVFFHVTNSTYMQLLAIYYVPKWEYLEVATFHRSKELTEDQFDVFVKNQTYPIKGWKCVERKHIQYKCEKDKGGD